MMEFVNGKDDIRIIPYIYMMENKKHVPTPQPDNNSLT
jgi:hypothetical protein